jgi:hypothetical protein
MPRSVPAIERRKAVRGCSRQLGTWATGTVDPAWVLYALI